MKKIIVIFILLLSSGISAQEQENNDSIQNLPQDRPLSVDEITYEMLNSLNNNDSESKNNSPILTKIIQKADLYFEKLWYAEAAELYEEALSRNKKNYSREILQKAGDAYYYNTNMEKAYHWYNVLYNTYKKDMSTDNLFKYAHTLKGTGKYGRAKKLMRLYNRKLKKESITEEDDAPTPNEIVLDNILSANPMFRIKNLEVNSEYSDFSPMFYNKEEVVFASAKDSSFFHTRRYKWNNQPYLDLYVSKINEESQELKNAIKFSKKINTKYHEASVSFSPDNKTMYFTRNNYDKKLKRDKKGVNNLKLYVSRKIDGKWSRGVELPFNSDEYSTGHPALSPDGKQLYFVSNMPGSIGKTDIFVVDILEDNSYSEPKNLGPEINTEEREMFPFINGKKLYFSSDGHIGLGGLDVYEIAYDEEEGFKDVKNVGQPINSNKDDFSYIVNEESQKGYFASNRKGGKGDDDIYSFKRLIVEEVEENLNAIAGVVTELISGDLMPDALVVLLDENNIKLKEVVSSDDGSFVFEDLESNTKYSIETTKRGYFDEELTTATKENEVVNVSVQMKKLKELIAIEDGIKKLKTDMIYFNFDKFNIRKDAAEELDKIVEVMTEYPDMLIKIESHTDARGKRAYNKYLSDKRAKSSRNYLIKQGIDPSRIESAIGYGEDKLINECGNGVRCSREKHELNRRSEFIIVKM
ncbi:MAG: OmpA family protein [Cellulophaga sp.]